MAHATTTIHHSGLRGRIDTVFAAIGRYIDRYAESRSRVQQINALNRLSDEQLAKRGIRREEIPAYVFRDLFYI